LQKLKHKLDEGESSDWLFHGEGCGNQTCGTVRGKLEEGLETHQEDGSLFKMWLYRRLKTLCHECFEIHSLEIKSEVLGLRTEFCWSFFISDINERDEDIQDMAREIFINLVENEKIKTNIGAYVHSCEVHQHATIGPEVQRKSIKKEDSKELTGAPDSLIKRLSFGITTSSPSIPWITFNKVRFRDID
jgi:hypothetical protein